MEVPAAKQAPSKALDLVLVATLVTLVLHPPASAYVVHYVRAAIAVGLVWPACRHAAGYWLALGSALAAYVWSDWEWADNHKYLAVYWCLALSLCLAQENRGTASRRLGSTARLLVGLVMLLAAGWKLATPEYRDGSFFEYELLADDRFARKTAWFLDVDRRALETNRDLVAQRRGAGALAPSAEGVELASSPRVAVASSWLTWLTVGAEGALAGLFLLPWGRRREGAGNRLGWDGARDYALLAFLVGTYLIAPVFGFGGLLAAMGAAQSTSERRRWLLVLMVAVLEVIAVTHRVAA
jgi:hypothetical protein